jgi:glycosyltransferase involved in cell wall biosynthesis
MRVAFFQRIFAQYQSGLVEELAKSPSHTYHFFGDTRDPLSSGIEVLPSGLRSQIAFTPCRTTHLSLRVAFQWRAVWEALFGPFDAFIFEGSLTMPTNWLALLAAKARRKKVFFYTHGWRRPDGFWKKFLHRGLYGPADGLLLYGWRARRIGEREGFLPERLHVVYNCLDEQTIRQCLECVSEAQCQEFRQEWFGADAARPVIIGVGRLVAAKRFELLVEAAGLLGRDGLRVNLLLVGDGPGREVLAAQAKAAGVDVAFTGARHDEPFLSLAFASADLSVIPGAAGLSVIHSLSYGTPVVVHGNELVQMPETEAVEDGINGAIFREDDVGDLARNMTRVLRGLPRGSVTSARCRRVIEAKYNPAQMRAAFDRAVAGEPAPTLPELPQSNARV